MEFLEQLYQDYSININSYDIFDCQEGKIIDLEDWLVKLDEKEGEYELLPIVKPPSEDICHVIVQDVELDYNNSTITIVSKPKCIEIYEYTEEIREYLYNITTPINVRFKSLQYLVGEAYDLCSNLLHVRLILTRGNTRDCLEELYNIVALDKDFLNHTNINEVKFNKLINARSRLSKPENFVSILQ